jgi:hypothetical protein
LNWFGLNRTSLVLVDALKCVQGAGSALWFRGRDHRAVGHDAVTERALPQMRCAQPLPSCAAVRSAAGAHRCPRVCLRLRQAAAAVPRRAVVRARGRVEPLWPSWRSLHHSIVTPLGVKHAFTS